MGPHLSLGMVLSSQAPLPQAVIDAFEAVAAGERAKRNREAEMIAAATAARARIRAREIDTAVREALRRFGATPIWMRDGRDDNDRVRRFMPFVREAWRDQHA